MGSETERINGIDVPLNWSILRLACRHWRLVTNPPHWLLPLPSASAQLQIEMALRLLETCMQTWKTRNLSFCLTSTFKFWLTNTVRSVTIQQQCTSYWNWILRFKLDLSSCIKKIWPGSSSGQFFGHLYSFTLFRPLKMGFVLLKLLICTTFFWTLHLLQIFPISA